MAAADCTSQADQKPGDKVNVERSQKSGGRNSGHYVQGHVDNTATVVEKYMDGESLRVRMKAPPDLAPYIVKKGYISIDGTSLTITESDPLSGIFAIMLVPHTQKCIVLPLRAVGERVNIGACSHLGPGHCNIALKQRFYMRPRAIASQVCGVFL